MNILGLKDTDLQFAKWATQQLCSWKNEMETKNLIKIHGTKDKLIPIKNKSEIIRVKNGQHFMIVDKPKKISAIINNEIHKTQKNLGY